MSNKLIFPFNKKEYDHDFSKSKELFNFNDILGKTIRKNMNQINDNIDSNHNNNNPNIDIKILENEKFANIDLLSVEQKSKCKTHNLNPICYDEKSIYCPECLDIQNINSEDLLIKKYYITNILDKEVRFKIDNSKRSINSNHHGFKIIEEEIKNNIETLNNIKEQINRYYERIFNTLSNKFYQAILKIEQELFLNQNKSESIEMFINENNRINEIALDLDALLDLNLNDNNSNSDSIYFAKIITNRHCSKKEIYDIINQSLEIFKFTQSSYDSLNNLINSDIMKYNILNENVIEANIKSIENQLSDIFDLKLNDDGYNNNDNNKDNANDEFKNNSKNGKLIRSKKLSHENWICQCGEIRLNNQFYCESTKCNLIRKINNIENLFIRPNLICDSSVNNYKMLKKHEYSLFNTLLKSDKTNSNEKFLISSEWFFNWKSYLKNDTKEEFIKNSFLNISVNSRIGVLPPGKIKNITLLDINTFSSKLQLHKMKLKSDIVFKVDYIVVNKEVWNFLSKNYGYDLELKMNYIDEKNSNNYDLSKVNISIYKKTQENKDLNIFNSLDNPEDKVCVDELNNNIIRKISSNKEKDFISKDKINKKNQIEIESNNENEFSENNNNKDNDEISKTLKKVIFKVEENPKSKSFIKNITVSKQQDNINLNHKMKNTDKNKNKIENQNLFINQIVNESKIVSNNFSKEINTNKSCSKSDNFNFNEYYLENENENEVNEQDVFGEDTKYNFNFNANVNQIKSTKSNNNEICFNFEKDKNLESTVKIDYSMINMNVFNKELLISKGNPGINDKSKNKNK